MITVTNTPHHFRIKQNGRLVDFMRQADVPGLINLAAGIPSPDLLPGQLLQECFQKAFAEDGKKLFAYQAPEGDHALREILADRLKKRGVHVSGEDLVMTTGCSQAMHLSISVLTQPDIIVAVECPAYYGMLELLSAAGVQVLPLPTDVSTGIDLEASMDLIDQWKPQVLVTCSSLSNPTGATIPEDRRECFVDFCRNRGIWIIEDDIYADLMDGEVPPPLRAYDDGSTVMYATGFSKTVAPGLRIGCSLPGKLYEMVVERKCREDIHSSVLSERMLKHYFLDDRSSKHLQNFLEHCLRRRKIVQQTLNEHMPEGFVTSTPRGGYMLWVQLPLLYKNEDLQIVREACLRRGVAFAHGEVFFTKKQSKQFMRLNCAKASEDDLVHGVKILGQELKGNL
ncbi:MAG: PLP-dependent aminotransferase family protein [Verrucomicrobiota bacterium]